MNIEDMARKIDEIRNGWGGRLLILGHHYQSEEVLKHVDVVGDSLELARRAAAEKDAERIVFCGVRFMAEAADILTAKHQVLYMPVPDAGCPLAETASVRDVRRAWNVVTAHAGEDWIPVVYVNSSASIKAFAGENQGIICTSSNAARVVQHVLSMHKKVFFLMDGNLGLNTACDLGFAENTVAIYDPDLGDGGVNTELVDQRKILLWNGHCYVHTNFKVEHVERARAECPDARIIVHPEVPREVVQLCDAHGSTSQIIQYVDKAPEDSVIFVGTELNLVRRLRRQYSGRIDVRPLTESLCKDMSLTTPESLLALLEQWDREKEVHVPEELEPGAVKALEAMLEL